HRLEPQLADVEQALADEVGPLGLRGAVEAPQADRTLVGAAFLDQPQDRVELLLRGEGFLGGDAQISAVTAGLQFVGHNQSGLREAACQIPWSRGERRPLGSSVSWSRSAKRRCALSLKS